ncbi:MAG: DUF1854 domain-containing protein [Aureliella sp.]
MSQQPTFSLEPNGQRLLLSYNSAEPIPVRALRMFPLTDPEHWIAIVDHMGLEVLCLDDPRQLSTQSQAALLSALQASEFVPKIERIAHVSGNSVPCSWDVLTDRGEHHFVVEDEKDVRALSGRRILVIDGHGIRYQIDDYSKLDNYSRRVIEWYV